MKVVPLKLFCVVLTEASGSPCREGPRGLSQKRKPVRRVKQHALHDRAAGTSTSAGASGVLLCCAGETPGPGPSPIATSVTQ